MNPDKTAEIADTTAEEITPSTSSGSQPPPNTVPNLINVSVSHDGSATKGDLVLRLQPSEKITNEEEKGEVNPEEASEITTPCNLPSDSHGNKIFFRIGHNLDKYKNNILYKDPIVRKLTRQRFSTSEPYNQDLIDIQNALASLELLEKIRKAEAAKKSTNNNPPAGKGNQKK